MSLPSGYKQLEYIQSSGTQWIDTGVKPTVATTIIVGLKIFEATGDSVIGNMGESDDNDYRLFNYSNNIYYDMASSRINGGTFANNTRYDFVMGNFFVNQGSSRVLTGTDITSFSTSVNVFIFKGATVNAKGNIYYFKMYNGANLVRDMVPCKTPQGAVGMYDLQNNKYYSNGGTGAFIAGPEVASGQSEVYVKVNGVWKTAGSISVSGY